MISALLIAGFLLLHWQWIAAGILIVVAARWALHIHRRNQADVEAVLREHDRLVARADQQHDEVLRGEGHGTYGDGWATQQAFDAPAD